MYVIGDEHTTIDDNGKPVKGMVVFVPYEAVYRLGLAVEQGQPEEAQRVQHGDATVDLVLEMNRNPVFLNWHETVYLPAWRPTV